MEIINAKLLIESIISVLSESLSSRVFHFLPLNSMYNIAKTNQLFLSKSERPSDERMSKGFPYYLSTSRTPSSAVGYPRIRIEGGANGWKDGLVRIEFDGQALNANFRGSSENYFIPTNSKSLEGKTHEKKSITRKINSASDSSVWAIPSSGNSLYKKEMPRYATQADGTTGSNIRLPRGRHNKHGYTDYNVINRVQMSEYEDRLLSNKPQIDNIGKYIVRIDILIKRKMKNDVQSNTMLAEIGEILRTYGSKVHIYNNEIAFNSLNVQNSGTNNPKYLPVDIDAFKAQYAKALNSPRPDDILRATDIKTVAESFFCIGYIKSCFERVSPIFVVKQLCGEWGKFTEDEINAIVEHAQKLRLNLYKEYIDLTSTNLKHKIEQYFAGTKRSLKDFIYKKFSETSVEYSAKLGGKRSSDPSNIFNCYMRAFKLKNSQAKIATE